jgi:hypothetical protein
MEGITPVSYEEFETKLNFLERFGDSDHQDLVKMVKNLRLRLAELEHSQMKKENSQLRKALAETNTNYVEVVNENLELRRKVEDLEKAAWRRRDYDDWKI